ncbi:MAG: hypothetical protein K5790_10380 [Nitrosopumilus sp.]|uniref:hypothetical protein n=1 Tax=Nitrosopumilus sp. TaxID=2024843 RepID=UPI00247E39DB|nr:hypothetical protein [Nitrosopumilus sp.]MCV0393676.1 hypothetical protein [Nitrosopumilus sp.]
MKIKSKVFFSLMILFAVVAFFSGVYLVLQFEELIFACLLDDSESLLEKLTESKIDCTEEDFMKYSIIWIVGTGVYLYLMLYFTDLCQKEWKKRRWA